MIRYSLVCNDGHGFEAWFRDSAAFDDQSRDSLLNCPACGSTGVSKTLMAPSIRRRGAPPSPPAQAAPSEAPPPPETRVISVDEDRFRSIRAALRELHAKVAESSENVGPAFPQEARKIHEGESLARSIYGTATADEVRSLIEDGIEIMPLPPLPEERN